jgi:hypothetical protein
MQHMARLLMVADDSHLLTEIYPWLAPAGFAIIETITNTSTALRLLHRTPHQYAVLAQVDAHSDLGFTFADLVELDYYVRSRHAFVFFTALPTNCLPPAALRLGYVLLSLPFCQEDLLNALHRPLIAIPKRPSIPLNLHDSGDAKLEHADQPAESFAAQRDGPNTTEPVGPGYSSMWIAGNGSIQQPPDGKEYPNSLV